MKFRVVAYLALCNILSGSVLVWIAEAQSHRSNQHIQFFIPDNKPLPNNVLTIQQAKDLYLLCPDYHGSDSNPTYLWKLPDGSNFKNSILTLKDINLSDTGNYTCKSTHGSQSFASWIDIKVGYSPVNVVNNVVESDHLVRLNGIYYLRSDENLVMNCENDADPVVHGCGWRFSSGNMYHDPPSVEATNGHCLFNQTVDVKFPSVSCFARNSVGDTRSGETTVITVPKTRLVNFSIPDNAKFRNNELLIKRDEDLDLSCSVDYGSDLGATYHWKGPNDFSATTSTLSLTKLSSSDTGKYTCTTTDVFGSFTQGIYIDVGDEPHQSGRNVSLCLSDQCKPFESIVFTVTFFSNPEVTVINLIEKGRESEQDPIIDLPTTAEFGTKQKLRFKKKSVTAVGNRTFVLTLASPALPGRLFSIEFDTSFLRPVMAALHAQPAVSLDLIIGISVASFIGGLLVAAVVALMCARKINKTGHVKVNPARLEQRRTDPEPTSSTSQHDVPNTEHNSTLATDSFGYLQMNPQHSFAHASSSTSQHDLQNLENNEPTPKDRFGYLRPIDSSAHASRGSHDYDEIVEPDSTMKCGTNYVNVLPKATFPKYKH